MTTLPVHMLAPPVTDAMEALQEHLAGERPCQVCAQGAHQRDLCPTGARLHDEVVRASQGAYEAIQP